MKVLKKYLLGILCLLFIGIMYSSLATASLGYEYLENDTLLHFWNDFDSYYVNVTSGIQLTNHQEEWWTKNVWCVGITRNYESVYCDDKYRINMAIFTDNSSYINITGGYSIIVVIDGVSYHLQTNLKYSLKDTDQNLTIFNSVKSLDNYSFTNNVYFYWKITNINISNNDVIDFLEVNRTRYYLDSNFSFNSSNLSSKKIFLGDDFTDESLWLTWNSLDYVGFFNQTVETVKINMGGINASETETIVFNWLDDICTWSCNMVNPSSAVSCDVGVSFDMVGYWRAESGSCPDTRVLLAQRNITGYENITSVGNISSISSNPQIISASNIEDTFYSEWTIRCDNAGNYTVRMDCDGSKVTAKQNVNVFDPFSVGCPIHNVASSRTLTGLNQSCINISSNNVVFDCAGNKMNVTYMTGYNPFAFNINGYSNITIKNCNNIQNYNRGFIINNASNITIVNNSFKNYYSNAIGNAYLYGVYLKNVTRLNFSNNIIINTSGTCTKLYCQLNVYNVYHMTNFSVFFNNVFNGAVKKDNVAVAPDPTLVMNVYSVGNSNNWSNNIFNNYSGLLDNGGNLLSLYGNNNIFNNNTFSNNPLTALYLYSGDFNIFNGLTITNVSSSGVFLLSNNNSFNNVNIQNGQYCFILGRSVYNADCDCDIITYAWNNSITNSTFNCSVSAISSIASSTKGNKFINVSLINDLLSGGMFTVENWAFVNVTNFQGVAFANVNVNISDKNNLTNNYSTTNASGIINSFLVMHYNGTTNFENHTVSANYTLSADYQQANFSSSRIINLQADSCNYFSPYGNWVQNSTQNCTIDYPTNMNNKNITCLYNGYVYIHNNISNTNVVYKNTNCIYVKWKNTTFS
jgi:hypothetical protein